MTVLFLILYILAAACFLAFATHQAVRVHLLALGAFFWVLVELVKTINRLT